MQRFNFYRISRFFIVGLPALVGCAFIGFLTYVLYLGEKPLQLASQAERKLMSVSMSMPSKASHHPKNIAVVSLKAQDENKCPIIPNDIGIDTNAETYALVLQKIIDGGAKEIIFSWLPIAHDMSKESLLPFSRLDLSQNQGVKIYFPMPLDDVAHFPKSEYPTIIPMEGDDCGYEEHFHCTYNKDWSDWVIQWIADRFLDKKYADDPWIFSKNLPHFRTNYLIQFSDFQKLDEHSFSEILNIEDAKSKFFNKTVFVGNAIRQPVTSINLYRDKIQRIITHEKYFPNDNQVPYHIFWAALAKMFEDDDMTRVVPQTGTYLLAVLSLFLTFFLSLKFSSKSTAGYFVFILFFFPFINAIGLKYFHIYIPCFEIIYITGVTILFFTFMKLAWHSYQKWRLDALKIYLSDAQEIKQNFISLTSHNLNTPIAKLQGLLDMLKNVSIENSENKELEKSYHELQKLTSEIQLSIKTMLIGYGLEEKNISISALTFYELMHKVQIESLNLMSHLQRKYDFQFESSSQVLYLDSRAFINLINIFSYLLTFENRDLSLQTNLSLLFSKSESNLKIVVLSFSLLGTHASEILHNLVNIIVHPEMPTRWMQKDHFFLENLVRFIRLYQSIYKISCPLQTKNRIELHVEIN